MKKKKQQVVCFYNEEHDLYAIVLKHVTDVDATPQERSYLISQAAFGYIDVIEANEACMMPQGIWRPRRQHYRLIENYKKWFGRKTSFNNIPLAIQIKFMDYLNQQSQPASAEAIIQTPDGYAVAHNTNAKDKTWQCTWIALDGSVIGTDTFRGPIEMWTKIDQQGDDSRKNRHYYPRADWNNMPEHIKESVKSIFV